MPRMPLRCVAPTDARHPGVRSPQIAVACRSNRALCHIKLEEYADAAVECDAGLSVPIASSKKGLHTKLLLRRVGAEQQQASHAHFALAAASQPERVHRATCSRKRTLNPPRALS